MNVLIRRYYNMCDGGASSGGGSGSQVGSNNLNNTKLSPKSQKNVDILNGMIKDYGKSIETIKKDLAEAKASGDKLGVTVAQTNITALNSHIGELQSKISNIQTLTNKINALKEQLK